MLRRAMRLTRGWHFPHCKHEAVRRLGHRRLLLVAGGGTFGAGAASLPCLCLSPANPKGLADADWYEEQNAHIALGLPLIEEGKQGWWHEVTRRSRNGESVNVADASGTTLLHLASAAGKRRLVEELLQLGAAACARDARGRTPLLSCAEHGSPEVAATLAKHGSDVNEQDDTGANALSIAARLGHLRLVRWLLGRPEITPNLADKYGVSALHKAVSFGETAIAAALLSDKRVAVDQPVGAIAESVPASYQAQSGGETALHLAASHKYHFHHTQHTRLAKALLAAGADPNRTTARGRTAAHCACEAGNVGVIKELVASGRVTSWTARDDQGRTPRDCAGGNAAVVAALPVAASSSKPAR